MHSRERDLDITAPRYWWQVSTHALAKARLQPVSSPPNTMPFQLTHSQERDKPYTPSIVAIAFQLTRSQERNHSNRAGIAHHARFQLTHSRECDVQLTDTDIVTSFDTVCANVFLCSSN